MPKQHNNTRRRPIDRGMLKSRRAIGKKFYAIRKAQKKSLKAVGKAISMSPSLLSQMEKGQYNFPIYRLPDLCNYYNISLKDVMP